MPGDPLVTEPFVCMDCAQLHRAGGDCSRCGKGPLLDGRDPDVRQTLVEDDDRRARKREGLIVGTSVLVAIPVVVGLELALPVFEALLRVLGCLGEIVASGALAVVLWQIGRRVFPFARRFAFLRSP